jgi:hypothetical protein
MVRPIWIALLCGLLIRTLAYIRHLNEHSAHHIPDITAEQLIEQGT